MDVLTAALSYRDAGLCVLPAVAAEKRAALPRWKEYQAHLPSEAHVRSWFEAGADALCLIAGKVSGNLELLDFDCQGLAFDAWCHRVRETDAGILDRLVIETSPSGGRHVAYRCQEEICSSVKLAQRKRLLAADEICLSSQGRESVTLYGKDCAVKVDVNGAKHVILTLIETRGEGGLCLCAPSVGYSLTQGTFAALPAITIQERETLLEAAWSLNEYWPEPVNPTPSTLYDGLYAERSRPGDDFNARGEVREVLVRHGWTLAKSGENQYWRRPGKTRGWSATLKAGVFYVFSSNADPFESNKAYSPFVTYALLEYGGDYTAAARALRAQGYGGSLTSGTQGVVLSGFMSGMGAARSKSGGKQAKVSPPRSLLELIEAHPALRKPIIAGLLREGETMNVIAPPKQGKSWLVTDLALAVATGRPWLGMETVQGDVLIIDNELHAETSANRIPKVAAARGISIDEYGSRLYIENLRGHLQDLFALGAYFEQFEPGRFKLIVLDAFYRFLPMRADENDNGTMANLYNCLDSFANYLKCSFVLIHHSSKGNQSLKDVTDVGAGAGAQSRATDTHLVIRHHENEDVVVMEAAVRSWPPVAPRCLRWAWPLWMPADNLDPAALKDSRKRTTQESEKVSEPCWDMASFIGAFLGTEPRSNARILEDAEQHGLSSRRVKRLLELAEAEGLIFRWPIGPQKTLAYATLPQPEGEKRDDTKRASVKDVLTQNPDLATKDVAERCGVSARYVQTIRREMEAN